MSNISTLYDAFDTLLGTTYSSTHMKLVNPYVVQLNDSKALNRGYGFYMGVATNSERNLSCKLSVQRDIIFRNTIVNYGTDRDVTIRQTAEKQLLEDQFLLIKAVESDPTIDGMVAKLVYSGDNGIEFIFDDEDQYNYLQIETTFAVEYFEDLTL